MRGDGGRRRAGVIRELWAFSEERGPSLLCFGSSAAGAAMWARPERDERPGLGMWREESVTIFEEVVFICFNSPPTPVHLIPAPNINLLGEALLLKASGAYPKENVVHFLANFFPKCYLLGVKINHRVHNGKKHEGKKIKPLHRIKK